MTLQELVGVELPIIQAPMAGSQGSALAIAVSNAGGLGSLPAALLGLDALRAELEAIRAHTKKPYTVNFFCPAQPEPDAARETAWRALLAPYFAECGVDAGAIAAAPVRAPFSAAASDVLAEFAPPVVSFHFGLPSPELVARVRAWGAVVLASATTVEEALWLEARGVDAVIAQGLEAGGHRGMFLSDDLLGQLGTFALVPQIAAAVKLPVIAAGGLATPDGVAAALRLGAAGVQVGTAYLLCPEATTPALHRAALRSEDARVTAVTNLFTGRPARGIVNRLIRELGPIHAAAPRFPLAGGALAPLRAHAEPAGRADFTALWAGHNTSACRERPAAEVTRALAGGGALEIAPFRPELADAVARLIVGIQRDEFAIEITAEQQPDLQDIPGFYQQRGGFWVALAGGRVVGTIALLDIGNRQAALRKMFVDREFRGAGPGVAQRLLEALLDSARERGTREIFLGTTAVFLAAHRFYEKNGFSEVGRAELPPAFPVMAVDSTFYRRRI